MLLRPRCKEGDIVFVEKLGVLGLFEWYLPSERILKLYWPENYSSVIWPGGGQEFSPVEMEEIKVLKSAELLIKFDVLVKRRDEKIRKALANTISVSSPHIHIING